MKNLTLAVLWIMWLSNTILGEETEAAVYIVGFFILLFMPDEKREGEA